MTRSCRGGITCLKLSPNLRHQAVRAEEMHSSPEGSPLLRIPRAPTPTLDVSGPGAAAAAAAGEAEQRAEALARDLAEAMAVLKRVRDSLAGLRPADEEKQ